MNMNDRCPWAIAFGVMLHTRCQSNEGHPGLHEGPGLAGYPDQRIRWALGDRREYLTDRADLYAWDAPPPASIAALVDFADYDDSTNDAA